MRAKFIIIILLGLTQSCFRDSHSKFDDEVIDIKPTTKTTPVTIPEQKEIIEANGIKTFRAINQTFSVLTGIEADFSDLDGENLPQDSIAVVYKEVSSSLPKGNSIDGLSESVFKSVYQLSAAYCDRLLNNESRLSIIFPELRDLDGEMNDQEAEHLLNQIKNIFWAGSGSEQLIGDISSNLMEFIQKMQVDKQAKRAVIFGACTISLSSPNIILK